MFWVLVWIAISSTLVTFWLTLKVINFVGTLIIEGVIRLITEQKEEEVSD